MFFLVRVPDYPLSQFVERLWFYEGYFPDHSKERVLPNGRMELLIELREGSKKLYDPHNRESFRSFKKSWLSGAQSGPIIIEAAQNSSMMGVSFKPGGAYPFLPFPVFELNDLVVESDLIWGRSVHSLRDRILESQNHSVKFKILEEFLLKQLHLKNKGNGIVHTAIQEIRTQNGELSIKGLSSRLGISQTHLARQFQRVVGIHPKFLSRILRFQKALHLLESEKPIAWSVLANDCGYYDQSHFNHEFKLFSGYNPSTYLNVRGEYINFIPIKEES
ncbi:helix-turn-helix domain-containing protein [bacterium]|nr:helix-turn-helix domain-containing protein [bacterium]